MTSQAAATIGQSARVRRRLIRHAAISERTGDPVPDGSRQAPVQGSADPWWYRSPAARRRVGGIAGPHGTPGEPPRSASSSGPVPAPQAVGRAPPRRAHGALPAARPPQRRSSIGASVNPQWSGAGSRPIAGPAAEADRRPTGPADSGSSRSSCAWACSTPSYPRARSWSCTTCCGETSSVAASRMWKQTLVSSSFGARRHPRRSRAISRRGFSVTPERCRRADAWARATHDSEPRDHAPCRYRSMPSRMRSSPNSNSSP